MQRACSVGASRCDVNFCQNHKTTEFKCANPDCPNMLHAKLVYGGAEFLDIAHDESTACIKGVELDDSKYHRDTSGQGARCGYFCEACSQQLPPGPHVPAHIAADRHVRAQNKLARIKAEHEDEKRVVVPEHMAKMQLPPATPGSAPREVVIRVIGPGLTVGVDKLVEYEEDLQDSLHSKLVPGATPEDRKRRNVRTQIS